jgi:hypothetical protein
MLIARSPPEEQLRLVTRHLDRILDPATLTLDLGLW